MKKTIKKILYIVILIILIFFLGSFIKQKTEETKDLTQNVLGLPTEINKSGLDLVFEDQKIRIDWYEVENTDNLFLTANFGEYTSSEFIENNNCKFLSSGGFYKSDYSPTGLLISEYEEVSPFVPSQLTNGIFSVNDFATPRISSVVPRDRLRLALQAGPLLKENGEFNSLSLKEDENARRVVVGVTGENKAYFLILYNPDSVLMGPYLKNLPEIISLFEKQTEISFADLLNLDGGSPTVFMSSEVFLTESSLVGSFFCLK